MLAFFWGGLPPFFFGVFHPLFWGGAALGFGVLLHLKETYAQRNDFDDKQKGKMKVTKGWALFSGVFGHPSERVWGFGV